MNKPGISALAARYFPTFGLKNIYLYYVITVLSVSWFIVGNWLFFALNYVTAYQFAIIEAISFGVGLILEIPSGAFADLFGKKTSI